MSEYDKGFRDGKWEMFVSISTTYHGKQYYFLQEDGLVYSRESCQYMTREEAINEFLWRIVE